MIFLVFSISILIIDKFLKGILQVLNTEYKKVPLKKSKNYFLSTTSFKTVFKKLIIALYILNFSFREYYFEIIKFKFIEGLSLN